MHSAVLVVAFGILAIIAYHDVRTRRIPNALSLTIATLGLTRIALAEDVVSGGYTLVAATVIFAGTIVLFRCGIIGGGDAKMIPATALLIGHRELLDFLFLMSLCGGALALVTIAREKRRLLLKRLWRRPAYPPAGAEVDRLGVPSKASTVPYGFAVATAGVITLITAR
jgi:prepilin peptidase CpaA